MSSNSGNEREILRQALSASPECPTLDELAAYLDTEAQAAPRGHMESHLSSCPRCLTEIALLKDFETMPRPEERADIEWVEQGLRQRLSGAARAVASEREPWWRRFWSVPSTRVLALGFGCLLVVVGIAVETRRSSTPDVRTGIGDGQLRSTSVVLVEPVGDLSSAPKEMKWQAASGVARYHVRLLEVDRHEIWSGDSSSTSIRLPGAASDRFRPGKTLLWQVSGYDAAGKEIASSDFQSVRVQIQPAP